MPISIKEDTLFKFGYPIKYITGWDDLFKKEKGSGLLNFYEGKPEDVICVEVISNDKANLTYDDIIVTAGEFHNPRDLTEKIDNHQDLILALCKRDERTVFSIDLGRKKIVEDSDFFLFTPVHGLHTLFMFENLPHQHYCLVNPSKNIPDDGFYSWLVSYIYSTVTCLTPRDKASVYAKEFLQAISALCLTKGNKKAVKISTHISILNCGLNDLGELLLPVPGKTDRYEQLVEKSLTELVNHKEKSKKK